VIVSARKQPNWMIVASLGLIVSHAQASGSVSTLSLKQAVHVSQAAFIVEKAEPDQQIVPVRNQPRQRGSGRLRPESLAVTYASFVIREALFLSTSQSLMRRSDVEASPPVKRSKLVPSDESGRYRFELPQQPLELLWLVDSTEVLNIYLTRLAIEKGVNKIPIYERLDGGIAPQATVANKPYLLLVEPSGAYQSYEGVGGWGLLDIEQRAAVEQLIEERHPGATRPPFDATDTSTTRPPNTEDDAAILETVFRHQFEHNDSGVQKQAAAYCLSLATEEDLRAEFTKRFRDLPKVNNRSGCDTIERESCGRVVERRTKHAALMFNIRSIRRTAPDTAVVRGDYFEACESAGSYEYVLKQLGSRWVILQRKTLWIS